MLKFKQISLLFILTNFISVFASENDWKLEKDQDSIKVYLRKTSTGGLEFKASTIISADIDTLYKTITDTENKLQWMDGVKSVKDLKIIDSLNAYEHNTISLPWPYDDRDMVFLRTIQLNEDSTFTIRYTSKPSAHPKQDDLVRINNAYGSWKLTPLENGRTEIVYQFFTDPEMYSPDWLTKMFIIDGPHKSLKQLKAYLKNS